MKPEDASGRSARTGRGCPGQIFQHVKHFVRAGAMDIEGFGEKQALRFLEDGLISDAADIYDLTAEQLEELEGFGEVSASNLIASIERLARACPSRACSSRSACPGSATSPPQALADHFGSIDALLEADDERDRARSTASARSSPSRSSSSSPTSGPGS